METINGKKYYLRTSGKKGVKGARYTSEWVTVKGERYYFTKTALSTGTP